MAAAPPGGFLLPLDGNKEDKSSIPKIALSPGTTYIGRDRIPVADKRLSRRHISVSTSADGSAHILVEGTNPVVIQSKGQRNKLLSGEKWKIQTGDIIELIPGHYLFKYVAANNTTDGRIPAANRQKRPSGEESSKGKQLAHSRKRMHRTPEEEALTQNSNDVLQCSNQLPNTSSEGIRNFRISKNMLSSTFRLLRVKELPEWANTNAVSINDVIQGNVHVAVLSNYMVDIDWLLSECPMLRKVNHVLVIHGEGDGTLEYMKRKKLPNWILHKPPLPISYGTHHSKAMLLVYPRGVRVIVHTANLIYVDWNNKTQGLWMQDFPWKDQNSTSKGCGFENDLVEYLGTLKWPEFNANLPTIGSFSINPSFFRKFDYSSATVRLIASVPGYHSGSRLSKWGHMKLRTVLQECTFENQFEKSNLIYQFSSLGSLDEKWMSELAYSMSEGMTEDKKPLGLGKPLIVWPSVEDVRCSIEGYASGNAIPSPLKNVEKEFLKKYWARWKSSHTGRCRAMPHIKSFARYSGQNLAWFLLTSSNLSKAAWGALQKNNSQLMIRSYEVLKFLMLKNNYLKWPNVRCPIIVLALHRKGDDNAVTAHGRIDPAQSTGFVFQDCVINGTDAYVALYNQNPIVHKSYLGRPWKEYSRTVFIQCTLGAIISPDGWMPWSGDFALNTLYYGEFENKGPGSDTSKRVNWSSTIPAEYLDTYSIQDFIQGDQWIPPTTS